MNRPTRILMLLASAALAATPTVAQTIDLNAAMGRQIMTGTRTGARASAWLHIGDLTGDFYNKELIIGSPNEDSGRGAVRLRFSRNPGGDFTTDQVDVVLTGGAAGDHFGAAADAGYVTHRDVLIVNGLPVDPTARDLIVGAPDAQGGRGEVYLFPGPFVSSERRTAANAVFTIIGRPGGRLGTLVESADLNGDGFREIIAFEPGTRCVHVIDAHNAAGITLDLGSSAAAMTICGVGAGPALATGDITGDKIFDLAIGAPDAAGGRGQVYVLKGRSGALPSVRTMPGDADAIFTGTDVGDGAGASLWIADIDDDSDPTWDLIIGAPGGDGPGNSRSNAGEVYAIWGSTALTVTLTPNLTLFGAGIEHRAGARVTAGEFTHDGAYDVVILAPGANGGFGEVYAYFGRHRYEFPATGVVDLATATDRRIIGDRAAGPIETIRVWEATGRGAEEIALGVPSATTTAGAASGRVYFALSPQLDLSNTSLTATVAQCAAPSIEVQITNPSVISVPWTFSTSAPWVRATVSGGSVMLGGPARFRLVAMTRGLAPGTYSANAAIISRGPNLQMQLGLSVQITVTSTGPSARSAAVDFTGDGCGDAAIFRATTGTWQIPGRPDIRLGTIGDVPIAGDYDGDQIADAAVYRRSNSTWYFQGSELKFGEIGDIAVPADYDGDGRTDVAVFRPSSGTWLIRGQTPIAFGQPGDAPVPADYDGDGRDDLAVYRRASGTWLIRGGPTVQWGGGYDMPVPADYNGDGRDDLALYNRPTGTWKIKDQFTVKLGSDGDLPVPMDFDRDGRADLALFQHLSASWLIYGSVNQLRVTTSAGAFGDTAAVLLPYLTQGIFATAGTDFNCDGSSDLLWQRADGTLAAWLMKSSTMVSSGYLTPAGVGDSNWRVAGVGDFNGDGSPDLLWQNRMNGTMSVWFMNGTRYVSSMWVSPVGVPDQLWRVVAVADFNGDNRPDLLWQHQTNGTSSVWFMNGVRMVSSAWVSQTAVPDSGWKIVAAADFNGNGGPDLLWQNRTTGAIAVWFLNGAVMAGSQWVITSHPDPRWEIVGASDVNEDGQSDVVWQHQSDGRLATWLMNGLSPASSRFLTPNGVPDPTWRVVDVR